MRTEEDTAVPGSLGIVIMGLGEAGRSHLSALESVPGASVTGIVDIRAIEVPSFRGHEVPCAASPAELAQMIEPPDVLSVVTPSGSHPQDAALAASAFPRARLLIEKPLSTTPDGLLLLRALDADSPGRVRSLLHASFSPEVAWAHAVVAANASQWGPITKADQCFADAYRDDAAGHAGRLGSSWLDSGANALSVLGRFVALEGLLQATAVSPLTSHVTLRCRNSAGQALEVPVLTSWDVHQPAKVTHLTLSCGVEMFIDHSAVTGRALRAGRVLEWFTGPTGVQRREMHYEALYRALVAGEEVLTGAMEWKIADIVVAATGL